MLGLSASGTTSVLVNTRRKDGTQSDCPSGVTSGCTPIPWPGYRTTAWHTGKKELDIRNWYGGLVDGMRDASGQMYMRNRYYDPATGQFTQTDPIGLAGGLNAYGFAAGDPVTYSDPYGLAACPIEWGGDGQTESLSDCPLGSAGQEEHFRRSSGRADPQDGFLFAVVSLGVGGVRAFGGSIVRSLARSFADESGSVPRGIPTYVTKTLKHVDDTGHAPNGYVGGRQFKNDGRNRGEVLPRADANGRAINYREWDVHPHQPGVNRGAERVVTGSNGSAYYTTDHYHTFTQIR